MALTIEQLIPKLVEAVNVVMNPSTPHAQRHEAYQACEEFKENSPQCVQCGLVLAGKQYDQYVRHFGFQLLEHSIKFRWNNMSPEDKLFIKENSMKLMAEGSPSVRAEEAHIKDALSRIVVEMIKREWPQHWPQLLTELSQLAKLGWVQMELVLLIFRRLAEDVVAFQNLPHQRRREILTTLTREMGQIYNFFLEQLGECFSVYSELKTTGGGSADQLREAGAVCCTVLDTLSAYVDWISMTHIMESNSLILQLLCSMLMYEEVQLPAAECLLLITNRKGKLEERKPLLIMFSKDAMQAIFDAATKAAAAPLKDLHYLFLKRLCQVLVSMGMQLAALWGAAEKVERPEMFSSYLEVILAFTSHSSQILSSYTLSLWLHFFRHTDIQKDPVLLAHVPKLINTLARMLCKVGLPSSQSSHESCAYAKADFDCDDDFNMFFARYRAEGTEVVRNIALVAPTECFNAAADALRHQLTRPIDIGGNGECTEHCTQRSPSYIEWDALSVFVESVMGRAICPETFDRFVGDGATLLTQVLQYNTKDPLILSCVLYNLSALFPFITHQPNILPAVLEKIFSCAVFHLDGQTKATRSRAVHNVRRHACSILVKLSKAYPHLLLPGFEQLYQHIKSLSSDSEELSHLEKVTLMEALVLISNKFENYEKQSAFVGEIMSETRESLTSEQLKTAICSAEKFMTFVGLDQAPVEPSSADTCGINRSKLLHCMNVLLHVMRRSEWPADIEVARKGGFVVPSNTPDSERLRNPAAKHLLSLLDHVLMLARTLNEIWQSHQLARRHPGFSKAYDLTDTEKKTLLGITPPSTDNSLLIISKQPTERMQAFLMTLHDACCHILGNAGLCLGHEFYEAPRLASFIINSYLSNMEAIPDYRLRNIIRSGMKPYVLSCPKEYYQTAVLPVLEVLGPFMMQKLSLIWQNQDQKELAVKEESDDEEDPLSDEVLNNQLIRLLSREYLEFLAIVFRDKKGGGNTDSQVFTDDMPGNEEENGGTAAVGASTHGRDESISELGTMVLKSESTYPSLVMTLFSALCWNDSTSCHKCSLLCWPVLKQLLSLSRLTAEDACHIFKTILLGMHCHGQHEATQAMLLTLGLQVYEHMRPMFPSVTGILMQIPNMTEQAVQQFDEKILNPAPSKQMTEKKKKDLFKKLIQDMIGKNVGQQFRKDVHIKNLPPLIKASKPAQPQPLEDSENLGLCSLFLP